MSNCRFTFRDAATFQRIVREKLTEQDGETFESALAEALQAAQLMETEVAAETPRPPAPPVPPVPPRKPQPEHVTPRPRITIHKEKTWAAPSGSFYAACSAEGCRWGELLPSGNRRKMHSDRQDHSFDEFLNDIEVESTPDGEGVREITVSVSAPVSRVAGDDAIEVDPYEPDVSDGDDTDVVERDLADEREASYE